MAAAVPTKLLLDALKNPPPLFVVALGAARRPAAHMQGCLSSGGAPRYWPDAAASVAEGTRGAAAQSRRQSAPALGRTQKSPPAAHLLLWSKLCCSMEMAREMGSLMLMTAGQVGGKEGRRAPNKESVGGSKPWCAGSKGMQPSRKESRAAERSRAGTGAGWQPRHLLAARASAQQRLTQLDPRHQLP